MSPNRSWSSGAAIKPVAGALGAVLVDSENADERARLRGVIELLDADGQRGVLRRGARVSGVVSMRVRKGWGNERAQRVGGVRAKENNGGRESMTRAGTVRANLTLGRVLMRVWRGIVHRKQ